MLGSFFKPVSRWSMARAKDHLQTHEIETYNLVDVRQPAEYAAGHIPGATLIPLGELPRRNDELDPGKLTLVYCHSGARSSSGVMLLTRAGFSDVHNIGGILEWRGLVATGAPEAAMAVFDAARDPAEYVALAWTMEESARLYYMELSEHFPELRETLAAMATAEESHRDRLAELYRDELGQAGEPKLEGAEDMMEGGIARRAALDWARTRKPVDVLEFTAAMEANAHDRYIVVGRAVGGAVERVFSEHAEAERHHLNQLMAMFEQHIGASESPPHW